MHLVDKLLSKGKDYKEVFETPAGKRVLADLAKFCQYQSTAFVPGDPNSTSYILGKQRVFRRITGLLNQSEADIKGLVRTYDVAPEESVPWES
jgi:hypothetical protein